MGKFIGRLVQVGVGKEISRGGGATPTYTFPFTKFAFTEKTVQARSNGALGALADSEEAFVTTRYGQGDIDIELRDQSIGLLLYAIFGGYSVSGPSDSAYTHSFAITQSNQHQSLAFTVKNANITELYNLVMLDSLKLTATLDKIIGFTASFMSKVGRDTGLTPPPVIHEAKFNKKDINVKIASNIAGLGAASKLSVKTLEFNIMKNVAIDDFLGTAEPEDIFNQQLSVEGTLELNYDAETFKNFDIFGTNQAMELDFVNKNSANVIGAATNPQLVFQMPKVDFTKWTPAYDLDKIVTQKISFKCSRDVANNLDIISLCQLVNEVPTY